MKFYEGCTALITGASSGLGVEFARQLAPHVHSLVLVARRLERLDALKEELESLHSNLRVHVYGADLGREDQRVAFVNWLPSQNVKVDFLINNAGLGDRGPFESSDWNKVRSIIDVNISALTHLIHLLLAIHDARRPRRYPQCEFDCRLYPIAEHGRLLGQQGIRHEPLGSARH